MSTVQYLHDNHVHITFPHFQQVISTADSTEFSLSRFHLSLKAQPQPHLLSTFMGAQ